MPLPTRSEAFPPEFLASLQAAQTHGRLFISSASPHALKTRIWAFQRALRKEGGENAFLANAIQVSVKPGGIELSRRSESPAAKELAAALASLDLPEGDALLDKLGE